MYARNKTGPRTVPCGTPLVTGLGVEVSPSSSTRWVDVRVSKLLGSD